MTDLRLRATLEDVTEEEAGFVVKDLAKENVDADFEEAAVDAIISRRAWLTPSPSSSS